MCRKGLKRKCTQSHDTRKKQKEEEIIGAFFSLDCSINLTSHITKWLSDHMDSMTCDCLYIVKWLGFSDTTKEPAMNLKNSTRFIKKFYSRKETMEYLENNLVKVFRTPTCKCILQDTTPLPSEPSEVSTEEFEVEEICDPIIGSKCMTHLMRFIKEFATVCIHDRCKCEAIMTDKKKIAVDVKDSKWKAFIDKACRSKIARKKMANIFQNVICDSCKYF